MECFLTMFSFTVSEWSSKRHCKCPCSANAEKISYYIGILNFFLSSLTIVGCFAASKYNINIIAPIFSINDQLFTVDLVEAVGLRVLMFGSVLALLFSVLLVIGVRRQRSCGVKAYFIFGTITLLLSIAFTVICVLNAFVDGDLIKIVPQIIFIFLYILYGLELAIVHRAFLNMDQTNSYQLLSSSTKLLEN